MCRWNGSVFDKKSLNMGPIFGPQIPKHGPGGSHIDMVYVYVPAFWGTFLWNLV